VAFAGRCFIEEIPRYIKKLQVSFRGKPSEKGVGFAPPFFNSIVIQDVEDKDKEIYYSPALCHEVFHKMQYKEDPLKNIKVLAEFALHKLGISDPYEYEKNTEGPITKLSDIKEVEGQAKYVGDFVKSVLNYETWKSKYENNLKEGYLDISRYNKKEFDRYKAEAIKRAKVLKNSGMKSYEINRFSGGKL